MNMDRQKTGLFGSYLPSYSPSDPALNVPVYSGGGSGPISPLSPYLNVDPSYLNPSGPEFIFPEGASRHRGRFELAFSQIGGSVMTGATIGGISGVYMGLREAKISGFTGSVKRTQLINIMTKRGAMGANALGVIAVMYSGFGVILSFVRGTDDELNTMVAGTATGLLYKSSGALRRCIGGGILGFGLTAAYCFFTSKDRIQSALPNKY